MSLEYFVTGVYITKQKIPRTAPWYHFHRYTFMSRFFKKERRVVIMEIIPNPRFPKPMIYKRPENIFIPASEILYPDKLYPGRIVLCVVNSSIKQIHYSKWEHTVFPRLFFKHLKVLDALRS